MKINDFDFNISFFFSKNKSFFPKIFQANFTLFRFYNVQTKYPIVISIKYRIDYMSRRTILTKKLQFLNFFAILLMQFHYRRLTFLQLFLFWQREVMIALLIFFTESFDNKSCFVVFFQGEQSNISSLNLSLERNFFQ